MSTSAANARQPEDTALRSLDLAAYNRFLPVIRRTAMRLARKVPKHITVGDLIGYGWIGLLESFQRAEPDLPPEQFEAYASYRIRGAMLDYLRTLDPATRDLRRASKRVTESISALTAIHQRAPEEEEIAEHLGVKIDEYHGLLQRIAQSGLARLELLDLDHVDVATDHVGADDSLGKVELARAVAVAIGELPDKLQKVLGLYYQEECTLREIGLVLGVTESRVCQLHSEAIHRLRARIGRR